MSEFIRYVKYKIDSNREKYKNEINTFWKFVEIYAEIQRNKNLKPGKRRDFSKSVKKAVLENQFHKCNYCRQYYPNLQFHHKDGNRSNNHVNNCEGLCPNCHDKKTRRKKSH